jgi:LmbE family N-acetylglucosaminyl deacetylase
MALRLLVVTAHPDDEAGGFGGALLKYRERGVETNVLCLTEGQAATHRGNAKNGAELAALRRAEFAASCKILKVNRAEVLSYPDGGLPEYNFMQIVGDLVRRMRQIRPHVVITFGTEGSVTTHPDHSMTSLFTTAAFHWAGRKNRFAEQLSGGLTPWRAQKLYYSTASFFLPEREPVSLAPATAIIDIKPYFELKIAAFHAHTSQAPLFPIFDHMMTRRGFEEPYHLAASITPSVVELETDLFAGVGE